MDKFGNRISELLRSKKITQVALAEMLGKSNSAVSDWCQGRSYPDALTLARLVEYFNVSADFLLNTQYAESHSDHHDLKDKEEAYGPSSNQLENLRTEYEKLQKQCELVNQVNVNQSQIIKFLIGSEEVPKKVSEKLLNELSENLQSLENQLRQIH